MDKIGLFEWSLKDRWRRNTSRSRNIVSNYASSDWPAVMYSIYSLSDQTRFEVNVSMAAFFQDTDPYIRGSVMAKYVYDNGYLD